MGSDIRRRLLNLLVDSMPTVSARWFWLAVSRTSAKTYGAAYTRTACPICDGRVSRNRLRRPKMRERHHLEASWRLPVAWRRLLRSCHVSSYLAAGRHDEDVSSLIMAAVGVTLAVAAIILARRIPVSMRSRRHLLAVGGVWLSRAGLLVGIPTIMILLTRIAFVVH